MSSKLAFILPSFLNVKNSYPGPHLLRGSLGPHVRRTVRILVKRLNSLFPNSLSFWDSW